MPNREKKVCYELIKLDSFVIIFSNAFVSPVVFAFFCLCVHLFKKKKKKIFFRKNRIQVQALKDIFSLVFDKDIFSTAKNNQR